MSQVKNILNIFEVIFLRFPFEILYFKEKCPMLAFRKAAASMFTESWLAISAVFLPAMCNIYERENGIYQLLSAPKTKRFYTNEMLRITDNSRTWLTITFNVF